MAYVVGEVAPAMKPNYVLRSWREGGQNVGAWLDSPDAMFSVMHPLVNNREQAEEVVRA